MDESMKIDLTKPDLQFALKLIKAGAQLTSQIRNDLAHASITKEDKSPVTLADFGVQALAGYFLDQFFKKATLAGEEDSRVLRTPEGKQHLAQVTDYVKRIVPEATEDLVCEWIDRGTGEPTDEYWTLDPVDGTKGFLRGRQYAIALATLEKGKVVLGLLGCPELELPQLPGVKGCVILAKQGEGTWAADIREQKNWVELHVSKCENVKEAIVLGSAESGHTHHGRIERVSEALGIHQETIRLDSQAKHALLAAGGGDILFRLPPKDRPDYHEKIWDVAAGTLVIQEAGGKATDIDGRQIDFSTGLQLTNNRGLLATNGSFHSEILKALQEVS